MVINFNFNGANLLNATNHDTMSSTISKSKNSFTTLVPQMNKSVGPVTVGTDYGNCWFFAPQVHLGKTGNEMRDFEAL